jgi:hypothetical protein
MKRHKQASWWMAAGLGMMASIGLMAQSPEPAALFPEMAEWQKSGKVETYAPENLYEHIDGAAENFLSYDFRQLAVQTYTNQRKQTLNAEIYFHGMPENAFGIYGSEKPLAGDYLAIGSQGYAEEGVLNFISGAFYVKLNGFDLGPDGKAILTSLAEKIAHAIGGENVLPEMLKAFPADGKIPNSERFFLNNFLGHEFLHSAYTADYDSKEGKFQLFIMQAGDEAEARAMLQRYAALEKGKPARDIRPGELTIEDPYNGPIRLSWRGTRIWGINGRSPSAAGHLAAIGRNLEKK